MKTGTKILIGLGGAAAAVGLAVVVHNSVEAAAALKLKILSINVKSLNQVLLKIQIYNPTSKALRIDTISGDLYFNAAEIGVLQYVNHTPIAPQGYTTFDNVLVDITPGGAVALAEQFFKGGAKNGTFAIDGKIYIGNTGIPFNQSYKW